MIDLLRREERDDIGWQMLMGSVAKCLLYQARQSGCDCGCTPYCSCPALDKVEIDVNHIKITTRSQVFLLKASLVSVETLPGCTIAPSVWDEPTEPVVLEG